MKYVRFFLVLLFSFSVTAVAKAETISDQHYLINSSTKESLLSLYQNTTKGYYAITSNRVSNGYNTTTYNYLCLFSDLPDSYDSMNINLQCNKLYIFNNNSVTVRSNTSLNIQNSIYASNINESYYRLGDRVYMIILTICTCVLLFVFITFVTWFKPRGGGFRVEENDIYYN